jgi:penicillin-binding protein 1A
MATLGEAYQPDATIAPELFEGVKVAERIISPQNAFLIQDAMREVVRRGTAVRARVLGRTDLSGKTGTSNDRRDAWFAGFNADLVAIVWVGYDDDSALGPREEGSRTALPVWIEFARLALKGVPNHRMDMPEGIVTVRISKTTGCPASASHPVEDVMFEHFREDTVPQCALDEGVPDIFNSSNENEDLF